MRAAVSHWEKMGADSMEAVVSGGESAGTPTVNEADVRQQASPANGRGTRRRVGCRRFPNIIQDPEWQ